MNICKLNISPPPPDILYTLNFVLETEKVYDKSLITETSHKLHLLTKGEGILHSVYGDFKVKAGDLFFTFSSSQYSFEPIGKVEYIYISFLGIRSNILFERLKINKNNCVLSGYDEIEFIWRNLIKTCNQSNTDLVSESALLYAFSVIDTKIFKDENITNNKDKILLIKKYVDENYSNSELTIEKTAEKFSYSKKYISELFKNEYGTPLGKYINMLRVKNATSLIIKGFTCIGDISKLCGFTDPLYFSKVFKKEIGISPKNFIKEHLNP